MDFFFLFAEVKTDFEYTKSELFSYSNTIYSFFRVMSIQEVETPQETVWRTVSLL